ncbi:acyl-CoA-binding protein homolog isoform X2 [Amyelois transitella]|uniref:acyl-CoA-binding protein homolog isoform X2 n=1 Tax=Amyelois transitella TaxID=680683 RepID=UPI00067D5CD1|nr:acyl-CoA-binding protein homolog isoform X2 [Amyelois transitella]XP_060800441.1 acyl-CoA-binding protein homolog isoform X2 [Amyelois transitella]
MSLQEKFDKAALDVKKLKSLPSNDDLLELYAYFKQATVGDADPANRPGMLDLKGKAKFDAWAAKKGTSKDAAMQAYIAKVESLIASLGLQ